MNTDDPTLDALLRRTNPVDPTLLPDGRSDVAQQFLRQRILRPDHRRGRHRLRPAVAIPAAAVLVGATAAAAFLLPSSSATSALSQGCYSRASLAASTAVVGTEVTDPVGECRGIWKKAFGEPAPASLTACVADNGTVAVFPGADPCRGLGLHAFNGSFSEQAGRFAAFKHDVVAAFAADRCVSTDAGIRLTRRLLAVHHLDGWTIDAAGKNSSPDARRVCASLSFDEQHRTVHLPLITPGG